MLKLSKRKYLTNCEQINIKDFLNCFKDDLSFKILIVDDQYLNDHDVKKKFYSSLMFLHFNIIIDLSEKQELLDLLIWNKTTNIKYITDNMMDDTGLCSHTYIGLFDQIRQGKQKLYIAVSNKQNFQKFSNKLRDHLPIILPKNQDIMCTNMFIKQMNVKFYETVQIINETIQEQFNHSCNIINLQITDIQDDDHPIEEIEIFKQLNQITKYCQITLAQLYSEVLLMNK
jgi:hypothetical protein